jgi:hypothetical protein
MVHCQYAANPFHQAPSDQLRPSRFLVRSLCLPEPHLWQSSSPAATERRRSSFQVPVSRVQLCRSDILWPCPICLARCFLDFLPSFLASSYPSLSLRSADLLQVCRNLCIVFQVFFLELLVEVPLVEARPQDQVTNILNCLFSDRMLSREVLVSRSKFINRNLGSESLVDTMVKLLAEEWNIDLPGRVTDVDISNEGNGLELGHIFAGLAKAAFKHPFEDSKVGSLEWFGHCEIAVPISVPVVYIRLRGAWWERILHDTREVGENILEQ